MINGTGFGVPNPVPPKSPAAPEVFPHLVLSRRKREPRRPGGRPPGNDQTISREDLVVGHGVASGLDPLPVDPENLVLGVRGVSPDEVSLLGLTVGSKPGRQDRIKDQFIADDREPALGRDRADHIVELALASVHQANRDLDRLANLLLASQRFEVVGDFLLGLSQGQAGEVDIAERIPDRPRHRPEPSRSSGASRPRWA